MIESIPPWLKKLYYRRTNAPKYSAQKRFLKDLQDFDAAYLWPATPLETFQRVEKIGKPIFLERINCYQGKAKRILDDAYRRLEVHPQHTITAERIQREEAKLEIVDFIFCPSPEVKKSFQEAGVPDSKLILTSRGWEPKRFPIIPLNKAPSESVTVLFVGRICVRKGSHLLLRAWERAGIKGQLKLCGTIEPVIAQACKSILSRPDVVHLEYNPNIAQAYREADIFAFPCLEEAGPKVTYEAMAHGLPILTSPMGAGSILRDGIDGIVIEPYDDEAWVEGLQKLVNSPELCIRLGTSACERAKEFTWDKVGARYMASILEKLND